MTRLIDKIEKREQDTAGQVVKKQPAVVQMTSQTKNDSGKNKQISAKVNADVYEDFTKINRMSGLSNNSALNMLIADYVREKKYIIEEK